MAECAKECALMFDGSKKQYTSESADWHRHPLYETSGYSVGNGLKVVMRPPVGAH